MSGSSASARASAARLIMPPDSSDGNLSRRVGRQADQLDLEQRQLVHQRLAAGRDIRASAPGCSPAPSAPKTARRAGTARRAACRSACARPRVALSTSTPNSLIVPDRFLVRPRTVRSSTDLPAPDAPTKPRISPRLTSRTSLSSTTLSPKATVMSRADKDDVGVRVRLVSASMSRRSGSPSPS